MKTRKSVQNHPQLPEMDGKKSWRIQSLLEWLSEEPNGLSLEQIATRLSVSQRTAKRYLAEIRKWNHELQSTKTSAKHLKYYLEKDEDQTTHFLPLLESLQKELQAGGNPRFSSGLKELITWIKEKKSPISTLSAPSDIYHIDHGPFAESDPPSGLLRQLERAVSGNLMVNLRYISTKEEKNDFLFCPYQLALRVGILYLIGKQPGKHQPFKSLAIRRIKRCLISAPFQKEPFDINEYYRYCFGQWSKQPHEKPTEIKFRIYKSWLKRFLQETHFDPPIRILETENGTEAHLELVVKPDLENWLLSLMPDLIPIAPEDLVNRLKKRLHHSIETFNSLGIPKT